MMREMQCNVAYRSFLRMRLTDKVPDASTLSQNRRQPVPRQRSLSADLRRDRGVGLPQGAGGGQDALHRFHAGMTLRAPSCW
jgi:hypothetical protein